MSDRPLWALLMDGTGVVVRATKASGHEMCDSDAMLTEEAEQLGLLPVVYTPSWRVSRR